MAPGLSFGQKFSLCEVYDNLGLGCDTGVKPWVTKGLNV